MKKIFTLLTIAIFSLISFNAEAQTGKLDAPLTQDVMQGSVSRYIANGGVPKLTSKYIWYIQESADNGATWNTANANAYHFVKGYEAYEKDVDGNYVLDAGNKKLLLENMAQTDHATVYVLWTDQANLGTLYRVRVDEKSSDSECFDPSLNANVVNVTVKENDFEISLTKWDRDRGNTSNDGLPNVECAIKENNSVGFLVSKNGGAIKYDDWKLSYEYRVLDNDGTTELLTWTRINDLDASDADADDIDDDIAKGKDAGKEKSELLGVITIDKTMYPNIDTDLVGDNGHITIEVRIVDAIDHKGMQAKNITSDLGLLPAACKASIDVNKIPAAQTIELD